MFVVGYVCRFVSVGSMCACLYVGVCALVCMRRSEVNLRWHSSVLDLGTGSSLNLKFLRLSWLTSELCDPPISVFPWPVNPWILLSVFHSQQTADCWVWVSQHHNHKETTTPGFLCGSGSKLRSSCLCGKCLASCCLSGPQVIVVYLTKLLR